MGFSDEKVVLAIARNAEHYSGIGGDDVAEDLVVASLHAPEQRVTRRSGHRVSGVAHAGYYRPGNGAPMTPGVKNEPGSLTVEQLHERLPRRPRLSSFRHGRAAIEPVDRPGTPECLKALRRARAGALPTMQPEATFVAHGRAAAGESAPVLRRPPISLR